MQQQSYSNKFISGAMVLAVAALITKILSAVYRVPFQNIVGDVGFYIYQQVYPFYGIALALATYGFPVVISKLIAESIVTNKESDVRTVLYVSFTFLSIIGVVACIICYTSASWFASIMGDSQLVPLFKIVSVGFLLMPILSVLRGYHQGYQNMIPTAVSQVTEQGLRVTIILFFTYYLTSHGASLYKVGEGAVIGSVCGGLASIFTLFFAFKKRRIIRSTVSKAFVWNIVKLLFVQGTAICLSGMILIFFQLADAIQIAPILTEYLHYPPTEAKVLKGIYDRGQPLLQMGTVVATAFSLTIVPLVSAAFHSRNKEEVSHQIQLAVKISMFVGLGAAVGLINIMKPTNIMLFEDNRGTVTISIFVVSILFSSLIITLVAVLQGIGHIIKPAICMIIGVILKFIGNIVCIAWWGTAGAAIATVISLLVVSLMLFVIVKKQRFIQMDKTFVLKLLLSVSGMTGFIQLWLLLGRLFHWESRTTNALLALVGVAIGAVVYIILLFACRTFTNEEVIQIPILKKLHRWYKGVMKK